ncbi:Mhp366/Mhp367 family surface (lipo)protein [Mesomycoplasma ovipneumoniae]|uniref:Mhp366/Mhp367 family surface (lipo)protein n=1 Tax=Mesomycoplasma ovipneumoniae TaxID=29562 RepID=UPI003080C92D
MKFKFFKSLAPLLLVNFFVISCTNFIPFQDRKNKDESAKNPVITEENQPKNQILPELQTPKNDLAQITQNLNPIGNIKTINDSNNDLSLTRENNNRITENSTSKNNHNLANSSISTIQNPSLDKSQIDNLNFSSLESLVKSNKPKPEPKVELDPKLEQILEQKPEQNPEEIPLVNSEISQVVKDLPVEKTPIINEKLEFSKLSNYDNKPAQKIGFDVTNKARGNAYSYEAFALKSNVIKQENDDHYLGEKNENLNIYWLDKINTGSLSKNEDARKTFFGYFNPRFRKNNFKPDYFGFRSLDYSDQRYKDIFQRNVRFSTGTAILLDSHEGESVFLTNRHVLYVNKRPFWELMAYPFMRFYDNDNVNTVDSLASSGMLSLFWIKTDYDRQIEQLKKRKNRFPGNNSIYIKSPNRWELSQFSTNLHKRYFREEKNFKNFGKDIGIFYFNHAKFREDIQGIFDFYQQHKRWLLSSFRYPNGKTVEDDINRFTKQFQKFSNFWDHVQQFPPLKISEKSWKNGEIDYTTKIGGFWLGSAFSKNMFKGVYIKNGAPSFFVTNGPGASGSGVYNTNGELIFLNQLIILAKDQKKLYYDQNNLTSHLTTGILLRNDKIDLVSEIKKFYYDKKQNFEK